MKAGSAQAKSCCVCVKPKKIMQQMHGIIPQLFDCWADPVAHLFLLKSSMYNQPVYFEVTEMPFAKRTTMAKSKAHSHK